MAGAGGAVRQVVHQADVKPHQVAALALDTTCCGVVALDKQGQPLRPALIWMDVRAAQQAAQVAASGTRHCASIALVMARCRQRG